MELYTNVMPALKTENLQQIVGKPVRVLSRSDVEEHAEDTVISVAKVGKVGFLVAGDPMVATTHVDLRLRAHKAGIQTRIIHAASVLTAAAGAAGLQSYKFGRTVTVPVSQTGQLPESVLSAIEKNLDAGLHSLVLLEIDVENQRHVTITESLERIVSLSSRKPDGRIRPETLVVGLARLESPNMVVKAGSISELIKWNFGDPPYCLIFPTQLHFVEAEALQVFCGARKELVAGHA
jgi:diphthine synthase